MNHLIWFTKMNHCMENSIHYITQNIFFYLMQVWNDIRVSQWWENHFYIWVSYSFKHKICVWFSLIKHQWESSRTSVVAQCLLSFLLKLWTFFWFWKPWAEGRTSHCTYPFKCKSGFPYIMPKVKANGKQSLSCTSEKRWPCIYVLIQQAH